MAFTSLKDRIAQKPLILCGPILRRVEPDQVTVWLALKEAKKVWLEVYEKDDEAEDGTTPVPQDKNGRDTIKIGTHLHLVAVTATMNTPLEPNKVYYYNIFFTAPKATTRSPDDKHIRLEKDIAHLSSDIIDFDTHYHDDDDLDIDEHTGHVHLPSFALAPADLNDVRLIHCSCRKPDAEDLDAMPVIDRMVSQDWTDPKLRPHYLFLTGDQIYADDVSPILLYMLMDAEESLLEWTEELPIVGAPQLTKRLPNNTIVSNLLPEKRKEAVIDKGDYTTEDPDNHLMTAGEYLAMYLFVWSDVLWRQLPSFEEVMPGEDKVRPDMPVHTEKYAKYLKSADRLEKFRKDLYQVRRALANIPTYMIFDDHDVTDDWYMAYDWCEKTLSNDLGRRLILNGLLTYALVQGWGNTPEQFAEGKNPVPAGKKLLDAAVQWFAAKTISPADETTMAKHLGLPSSKQAANILKKESGTDRFMIDQQADRIIWHYTILREQYEIIVLDSRTRRSYPDPANKGKIAHPDILSQTAIREQLALPADKQARPLTLIVAPTPVVSIPAIDFDEFPFLVRFLAKRAFNKNKYEFDVFDHWKNQSATFEELLSVLVGRGDQARSRYLILTGDVHFSAASRLNFQADRLLPVPQIPVQTQDEYRSTIVQLVSSSLKKQTDKTRLLHQRGYRFGHSSAFTVGRVFLTVFPDKLAGASGWKKLITIPLLAILLGPFLVLQLFFYLLDRFFQTLDKIFPSGVFEKKLPAPKEFFGWQNHQEAGTTKVTLHLPGGPGAIPVRSEDIALPTVPVVEKNVLEDAINLSSFKPPQWKYRTEYILAENEPRQEAELDHVMDDFVPSPGDRSKALDHYMHLAAFHLEYARKWGNGKEIVGVNNVSEVFFTWTDTEKEVRQESWWRLKGKDGKTLLPFPLTKFKVSMDFDDDKFKLPDFPT